PGHQLSRCEERRVAAGARGDRPAGAAERGEEGREDAALGPEHHGALALEQQRFALHTPAIAAQVAALPHHAVAGNDESDRVPGARLSDRAHRARLADRAGHVPIAPGRADRDHPQRVPYALLERCAAHVHGQLEAGLRAREMREQGFDPFLERPRRAWRSEERRVGTVTGVQTCALPISTARTARGWPIARATSP